MRGFDIPEDIKTKRGFGVINNAKQAQEQRIGMKTIFPKDNPMIDPDHDPEVHKLYVTTHSAYAPGEMRDRAYDWQSTNVKDPKTHAFGYCPERIHEGVRKALNPATDPEVVQNPKIVPKHHEEHKIATYDVLGKPKFHGTVSNHLPAGTAFGQPSLKKLEPGAGKVSSWRWGGGGVA